MEQKFGIVIASHISNIKRIYYLVECLQSLIDQTLPCNIYLSISFETCHLKHVFINILNDDPFLKTTLLKVFIREQKTPQMRHIQSVLSELETDKIDWIMFCDDDDTYEENRVSIFYNRIQACLKEIAEKYPTKCLAGAYESTFGKHHEEQRHEFWCYCISFKVLNDFYRKIYLQGTASIIDPIIEHNCCDIIFGEYLRRLMHSELYMYSRITEPYYNYRVEESDSITGIIKVTQSTVWQPMIVNDEDVHVYVKLYNEYLEKNIHVYLHDTYLRTSIGNEIDEILKAELKRDYRFLDLIDKKHIDKIRDYHDSLKRVVKGIYGGAP